MAGDNDSTMKALLHFESGLTDSAAGISSATTWTAQAGTAVSASQQKFGAQSLSILQSVSSALRGLFATYRSEYSLAGSSPSFVASCWVYIATQTFQGSQPENIFAARDSSPTGGGTPWNIRFIPSTKQIGFGVDVLNNGGGGISIVSSAITLDAWHFLEVGKIGSVMYASVDGVVSSANLPNSQFASSTTSSTTLGIAVGAFTDFSYVHPASYFVDEAAYKIGALPHVANFTPPAVPWGTVVVNNDRGTYSYLGVAIPRIVRSIFHARGTFSFVGKVVSLFYGKFILTAAAGAYSFFLQATLGSKNGHPILLLAAEAGQYIKSGFTNYLLRAIQKFGLGDPPSLQKTRRNPPTLDM